MKRMSRLAVLALAASTMAFGAISGASAQITVAKPVKLSIIDVAGNLQLSKPAIEAFKAAHPEWVADIEYIKLTAPELPSKLKAQQMAGNLDTTLVLTGYDAMASGIDQNVYEKLMPKYASAFQKSIDNYVPGAKAAYDLFGGYGITSVYCPGGPMLTYNPAKVPNPPKTPAALLAWAKANPGKFMYARPANSGPGRAFLQGLPYILGDKNPKDPATWDKTWAFLKELDNYIDYYPSGTGITFKELGDGTRWMIASHLGWDMNQRILGTIPANFQGYFLDNTTWVTDAHFMAVPKGLDKDRLAVTIELMKWLLLPAQQAVTYDDGYFYPGPAIKGVPISMAPAHSQQVVTAAMRPAYDKAMNDLPNTPQLDSAALVKAMDMWDELVGAKVKK
ncbi:MAG TPA: extracellular solute-binding protein [Rectinemataceae bacterium]|nr:extracellular solute-binding protein [Rectinemataceae bacterium]